MTYLEIVNKVLVRLRENEVSSLTETSYSKLVADLVNVVKREVENAWNWDCLRETLTVTTANDLFNYVLTDSGTTSRVLNVYNDTDDIQMHYRPSNWFDQQMRMVDTVQKDAPMFYNWNGTSNGDLQVDLYPIPDGVYNIRFNIIKQQDDLSAPTDVLLLNPHLVIEGVVSRAISERGDDGGFMDQEMRYKNMLADFIAIEAGRMPDEVTWYPE
jgi:hypothetical protein